MIMKEEFIWLTVTYQSDFETLHLVKGKVECENIDGMICFKGEAESEAKDFLRKLKQFLKKIYGDRYSWMNDNWVNNVEIKQQNR